MSSNNTALNNMYIADLEICTPLSNDVAELNEKIQANDNEFSIANFDGSLGLEINMSLCESETFSAIKQPLQVDEKPTELALKYDTVHFEPDSDQVHISWRANHVCLHNAKDVISISMDFK